MCVGQGANIDFRDFSTYCAKAIAGIGQLPDTVRARAFAIRLEKIADEQVEEFDEGEAEHVAGALRDRLEGFALAGVPKLEGAKPERPGGLSPRTKEISRPLLAIADLAGGEWPLKVRRALVELGGAGVTEDESIGVELLRDIRDVFDRREVDRIPTTELVEALVVMDERPWGEWRKGLPISARGISRLLKPYGIRTRSVRLEEGGTPKGLLREQLEDAWKRYVPQKPPSYPPQRHIGSNKPDSPVSYPPHEKFVADRKPPETASESQCGAVADRDPVTGEGDVTGANNGRSQPALRSWEPPPAMSDEEVARRVAELEGEMKEGRL